MKIRWSGNLLKRILLIYQELQFAFILRKLFKYPSLIDLFSNELMLHEMFYVPRYIIF